MAFYKMYLKDDGTMHQVNSSNAGLTKNMCYVGNNYMLSLSAAFGWDYLRMYYLDWSLSPRSLRLVASQSTRFGAYIRSVTFDGEYAYTCRSSGLGNPVLNQLDYGTGKIADVIATTNAPSCLACDGKYLYYGIKHVLGDYIQKIDMQNYKITRTYSPFIFGNDLVDMTYDDKYLYVLHTDESVEPDAGKVLKFDTETGKTIDSYHPVADTVLDGMMYDGHYWYFQT